MKRPDLDILIVGAGPVGLFLANECARRSLRYRIVESRPGQSVHSKALAVMPRTLEIFDMAGIVDGFVEAANQVTSATIHSHQRLLARLHFAPKDSPYPFVGMVPQNITEALLVDELRRRGGAVAYNTSCIGVQQGDGEVDATLEREGQFSHVSAQFVVGCDGAHSTIRHLLDIPFDGDEYDATFLLADIETNDVVPADEMQFCPHEAGPVLIFPMSKSRRRIVATTANMEGDAPPLELVQSILAERAPETIVATRLNWSSYFRIHHRQVAKLQVDRIFIAGDAAHIHSPFGGQGMNTGLQDAWNLIWKLEFAIRGLATDELLESYTKERRPIIKHVIEVTDLMTKAFSTPNRLVGTARDFVIPMLSRLAPFQRNFVETLSELGVVYRGSPIVDGLGERLLDQSMLNGGICSRFVLFSGTDNGRITPEAERIAADYRDVVEARYSSLYGTSLVRPDGYVTIASTSTSTEDIRMLLARQTRVMPCNA